MPTFNFETINNNKKKSNNKYINNKIIDIVIGFINIDINGNYYIKTENNNTYNISKKSYSCIGKYDIFSRFMINNSKIRISKDKIIKEDYNHKYYLPFAVGMLARCNIILENNIKTAIIKNINYDNQNPLAVEAMKFYRNNYDEIIKKIENE